MIKLIDYSKTYNGTDFVVEGLNLNIEKGDIWVRPKKMWNENKESVEIARHAKEVLYFKSDIEFTKFDMFRQNKSQD